MEDDVKANFKKLKDTMGLETEKSALASRVSILILASMLEVWSYVHHYTC